MENPWIAEHPVLNGRYKIVVNTYEVRMSHWINGFSIMDTHNDNLITDLTYSGLNLIDYQENNSRLKITGSLYPRAAHIIVLDFNLSESTVEYKNKIYPVSELQDIIKEEKENSNT